MRPDIYSCPREPIYPVRDRRLHLRQVARGMLRRIRQGLRNEVIRADLDSAG
jgi:hypothetical protein